MATSVNRRVIEQASPGDAANFALEGEQPNVVTLAGLLAPGGFVDGRGVPDIGRLRSVIADRVRGEPALCRRAVRRGGNWAWEQAEPDLMHHVRTEEADSSAARPEGGSRLPAVCARVVMTPLAKDRPLWEILLVPHVDGRRCGILFRLHHALADGFVAEELIQSLADPRGFEDGDAADRDHPAPPVTPSCLRAIVPRSIAFAMQSAALFRRTVRSRVLLGPLSGVRDIAFSDVDLAALHDGAHRGGATVNDAFLMAFGQGIRRLLETAGEPLPEAVPISCPVLVPRRRGEGNSTGVMLPSVPVAASDAAAALARVAAITPSQKARARASGTFTWMRGPRIAALLMRVSRRQRAVAAIASELTGPPSTLYFAHAELVSAWALSLLSENVRVGTVGLSYAGRFWVSVQTDAANVPQARVVAAGMLDALQAVAGL